MQIEITTTPAEHTWQEKNRQNMANPGDQKIVAVFLLKHRTVPFTVSALSVVVSLLFFIFFVKNKELRLINDGEFEQYGKNSSPTIKKQGFTFK